MKCRYHHNLAAYQTGALSRPDQAAVRDHLAQCPRCQQELDALEATVALLRPMPVHDAPPQTWAHIQSRLTPRRRAAHPLRQWAPVFVAALLLVVVAVTLLSGLQVGPLQPGVLASDGYAQVQLAAAWDNPLADKAALGLALIAVEDEANPTPPTEALD